MPSNLSYSTDEKIETWKFEMIKHFLTLLKTLIIPLLIPEFPGAWSNTNTTIISEISKIAVLKETSFLPINFFYKQRGVLRNISMQIFRRLQK